MGLAATRVEVKLKVGGRNFAYYGVEPFRRAFRLALLWWFGIARWHLASAENKPYVRDIVAFINAQNYRTVCELGCGLGDILSRLAAIEKYGFDADPKVVRAARILKMLRRDTARYETLRATAEHLPPVSADVWILVNWVHEVPPDELQPMLQRLLERKVNEAGCLIIDSVAPRAGQYHHDPQALLAGLGCSVSRIGGEYPFGRSIYVIFKKRHASS